MFGERMRCLALSGKGYHDVVRMTIGIACDRNVLLYLRLVPPLYPLLALSDTASTAPKLKPEKGRQRATPACLRCARLTSTNCVRRQAGVDSGVIMDGAVPCSSPHHRYAFLMALKTFIPSLILSTNPEHYHMKTSFLVRQIKWR